MPFITRFAPSPNGLLHLGHAYSALVAQHLSGGAIESRDGQFLLRIEDIDLGRSKEKFIDAIYEDLGWLGIEWNGEVMMQSTRFEIYEQALQKLRQLDVVYPCGATRQEIRHYIDAQLGGRHDWPVDPDGAPVYPGICRDISSEAQNTLMCEGGSYAWRINMRKARDLAEKNNGEPLTFMELNTGKKTIIDPMIFGDVVIARKDMRTSYHLSVVVDDAAQNINLVTRGMDLFAATHIHRVLQNLLDLPEPAYFHHDLIRNDTGRRLSKMAGDEGFSLWRQSGASPQDVLSVLPALPEVPKVPITR